MKISLIGCSKKKLVGNHLARNLFQGTLFQKSLAISERLEFDMIYILSAKYGLLALDRYVDSYEDDLTVKNKAERLSWSELVKDKLPAGEYHYFCGKKYWEFLPSGLTMFQGGGIGEILSNLNQELASLSVIT